MEGCICSEQHIPKTHEAKSDRLKGDKEKDNSKILVGRLQYLLSIMVKTNWKE